MEQLRKRIRRVQMMDEFLRCARSLADVAGVTRFVQHAHRLEQARQVPSQLSGGVALG
jgi:hypothetical protein